jgi:hypothetical protein
VKLKKKQKGAIAVNITCRKRGKKYYIFPRKLKRGKHGGQEYGIICSYV